jgi:hypothetical protein
MQTTTINRPWFAKMAIFFLMFAGFGLYGLYDASVSYPARGRRFADVKLYEYLKTSQQNGPLTSRVSVPNPKEELARLKSLTRAATPEEQARVEWLESLQVVGELRPERTTIAEPDKRYAELQKLWASGSQPKPLAWYDIWVQWAFTALGLGGAAWLALLFLRVSRVKYRWEETTQTLTIPDGATITPADIEDFDKRKWDKYLIFLKIKPGCCGAHAGREIKLDLYRHAPLESWVLEMERTAFPDRAQESEPAPPAPLTDQQPTT